MNNSNLGTNKLLSWTKLSLHTNKLYKNYNLTVSTTIVVVAAAVKYVIEIEIVRGILLICSRWTWTCMYPIYWESWHWRKKLFIGKKHRELSMPCECDSSKNISKMRSWSPKCITAMNGRRTQSCYSKWCLNWKTKKPKTSSSCPRLQCWS